MPMHCRASSRGRAASPTQATCRHRAAAAQSGRAPAGSGIVLLVVIIAGCILLAAWIGYLARELAGVLPDRQLARGLGRIRPRRAGRVRRDRLGRLAATPDPDHLPDRAGDACCCATRGSTSCSMRARPGSSSSLLSALLIEVPIAMIARARRQAAAAAHHRPGDQVRGRQRVRCRRCGRYRCSAPRAGHARLSG